MESQVPDGRGDTPMERAAHYWKKAAEAYSRACEAESDEVKKLYIQVAMSWAALAHELERAPPASIHERYGSEARH